MEVAKVVLPVVGAIINTLGSPIWTELETVWGVKDDIESLKSTLSTISLVLEDAESRAIKDGALRKWLKDLKDVAFDAEDVLDEFQTEAAHFKGKKEKVRQFFSSRNTLVFRYKMARKIKDIVKRLDEIAEERKKFHLAKRSTVVSHPEERETFSYQDEQEIIGRDDDKKKVMEWVMKEVNDDEYLSVLPIVGLGGLGKTTLARSVYNDEIIMKHFENRIWVCVGEDFDVKAVAKAVIECGTREQCAFSRLEDMHRLIREKIASKRYLLVLDDVWNENTSEWEKLKNLLRGSMPGNKIVVTTRSRRVAEIMGTTNSAYMLKGLKDDDCWMLFKQRAFGQRMAEVSSNLAQIGKEIVQRCKGLPLAAKSLGSLMATKKEEEEWLAIKNNEIWNLDQGSEGIIPALQLSYDHLSSQLKQCFSYCSVFPKDYYIDKLRLIQLWIAQGFIQSNGGMNVEDIGNQYFNNLLNRSFFQDEEKDKFSHIESCKMHDLIHDLACFVAKDESSIVKVDEKITLPQGCRYSSIIHHEGSSSSIVEIASQANKLRSFFLLSHHVYIGDPNFSKEISNLTRLRALHLNGTSGRNIVNILRELKHLRFLELSWLEVEKLPDSITDLRNLQTLNIGNCWALKELPKSLMMMSNLRHLNIKAVSKLKGMPRGIGKLTNLQTLSTFCVGKKQHHASIVELQHLNQIRGELDIDGLDNVKDRKDAMEANLNSKSGLLSLKLNWRQRDDRGPRANEASASYIDVLENLQPHPNLKSLKIWYYGGSMFPNWFTNLSSSSLLPNLVYLSLAFFSTCESLPPLGLLPYLKELCLYDMPALKKIGKGLYGESALASPVPSFPSLKRMTLEEASNLEEWWVPERDAFPSLEYLEINNCPKLTIHGRLPSSLVELLIWEINEEVLAADGCLQGLSRLTKLKISDMKASRTSWKELHYLTSLEELHISLFSDLICIPEGLLQHHFCSLQTLFLYGTSDLESLGGRELDQQHQPPPLFISLHHLDIWNCPKLTVLPEWLRGLTSLQSLTIRDCDNLKMLPDGIQHLSGLKQLTIVACPLLERSCERVTGEDWYKIAHIPNLTIIPRATPTRINSSSSSSSDSEEHSSSDSEEQNRVSYFKELLCRCS